MEYVNQPNGQKRASQDKVAQFSRVGIYQPSHHECCQEDHDAQALHQDMEGQVSRSRKNGVEGWKDRYEKKDSQRDKENC